MLRGFVVLLILALPVLASMFDLPSGHWSQLQGEPECALTIGTKTNRELQLTIGSATASGVYRVTATKGDYHVTWSVQEGELPLPGFTLRAGDEVRLILDYGDAGLRLVVFDQAIKPILTVDLKRL